MTRRITLLFRVRGSAGTKCTHFRPQGLSERFCDQGSQFLCEGLRLQHVGNCDGKCHHALALYVVRNADHGSFGDCIVRNQNRLHFRRSDAFPRNLQSVVATARGCTSSRPHRAEPNRHAPKYPASGTSMSRYSAAGHSESPAPFRSRVCGSPTRRLLRLTPDCRNRLPRRRQCQGTARRTSKALWESGLPIRIPPEISVPPE